MGKSSLRAAGRRRASFVTQMTTVSPEGLTRSGGVGRPADCEAGGRWRRVGAHGKIALPHFAVLHVDARYAAVPNGAARFVDADARNQHLVKIQSAAIQRGGRRVRE